mmetsp:Transcript_70909/g.167165  ORF Transcript_70909/g.167165 Transcript_70909/m.167165 type:complete len:266 (-) Transcript_70909:940-1737(-)
MSGRSRHHWRRNSEIKVCHFMNRIQSASSNKSSSVGGGGGAATTTGATCARKAAASASESVAFGISVTFRSTKNGQNLWGGPNLAFSLRRKSLNTSDSSPSPLAHASRRATMHWSALGNSESCTEASTVRRTTPCICSKARSITLESRCCIMVLKSPTGFISPTLTTVAPSMESNEMGPVLAFLEGSSASPVSVGSSPMATSAHTRRLPLLFSSTTLSVKHDLNAATLAAHLTVSVGSGRRGACRWGGMGGRSSSGFKARCWTQR